MKQQQPAEVTETAPDEPAQAAKRIQALLASVEALEHCNSAPRVIWAPQGCTPEDVRYPQFWGLIAPRMSLRPFDRFEVRAHDRTWRLECTILSARQDGADIHIDRLAHLKASGDSEDSDGKYVVRNTGGPSPWEIVRAKDQKTLPGRYPTKDAARLARAQLYPKPV